MCVCLISICRFCHKNGLSNLNCIWYPLLSGCLGWCVVVRILCVCVCSRLHRIPQWRLHQKDTSATALARHNSAKAYVGVRVYVSVFVEGGLGDTTPSFMPSHTPNNINVE